MPYTHGVRHAHHHNVKRHSHLVDSVAIPENDQPYPTTVEAPTIVQRAESSTSSCSSSDGSGSCTTSKSSAMTTTLPVVLGAVIPIVCAIIVLIFLHRRHVRKLRAEDANDKYKSMDFGMGAVRAKGGANPEMGEKPHKRGGMSLDIGNSPYLLPPGLQHSKESLRSLSKVISSDDDKYRVAAHTDNASLRSYPSHTKWGYDDTSSVGGSTRQLPPDDMQHGLLQNASRMSKSSPPKGSPPPNISHKAQQSNVSKTTSLSDASVVDAHLDMPKDEKLPDLPAHEQPLQMNPYPQPAQPYPSGEHDAGSKRLSMPDAGFGGFNFGTEAHETSQQHDDLPTIRESPVDSHVAPQAPRISLPLSDVASDYGDDLKLDQFPSVNVSNADDNKPHEAEDFPPGANRTTQRFTKFDEGFDPHRLTVGIRPLPPEDPADNPEQRANRIRSFYKEYFDDSKGIPAGGQEEYYEDFGPEFYDDPGMYDPYYGDYMTGPPKPFAQPMGRRAMTPPPRFQGPPRTLHSSAGFRSPGPRAFSSASGRLPGRGPKPLPPPEPLHVLPSPSMMSDDMSVLPIDYAPGKNFKDQQAGRPESPRGGLRPYTPGMPSRSPLASSFDDLAAIPSPHALRKSGVFMPLGFAPPPRFKNEGASSDSGSIRSNRSGISANHMHNIRAGAYRVSRLPADTVGTRDDIGASLRPKWDMR